MISGDKTLIYSNVLLITEILMSVPDKMRFMYKTIP